MKAINILQDAMALTTDKEVKRLLQLVYNENVNAKTKFNIFDFVAKDKLRPQLQCMYHENGIKAATNGHILTVIKSEYAPELEGVMQNKDLTTLDKQGYAFPRYERVLPSLSELEKWGKLDLDIKDLTDKIKHAKANKKTGNLYLIKVGNYLYAPDLMEKFLSFCVEFVPTVKEDIYNNNAPKIFAYNYLQTCCLLMSVVPRTNDKFIIL